jgi:hypothetical protein
MSTSLLYHGFGIIGYQYIRTEYLEGDAITRGAFWSQRHDDDDDLHTYGEESFGFLIFPLAITVNRVYPNVEMFLRYT